MKGASAADQRGCCEMVLRPGDRVGSRRFRLERVIGRGGMGTVWLALDERLNEHVALKFISERIRGNSAALASMRQETRKSHFLSHPGIIRIHDLHEVEGEPAFISMEFVDGKNLHELACDRPARAFTLDEVWRWMPQLCEALGFAHSRRVVHRDLKPANLMLDQAGNLKLADFGLSDALRDLTEANNSAISGTPAYMSPQQFGGAPATVSDDIYSLGACVFELLVGAPMFEGPDLRRLIEFEPAPLLSMAMRKRGVPGEIPEEFEDLVQQCVSKVPDNRPRSAEEFLERAAKTLAPEKAQTDPNNVSSFSVGIRWRLAFLIAGLTAACLLAMGSVIAAKSSRGRFLDLSRAPVRASSHSPTSEPKRAFDGIHRHQIIREATRWASSPTGERASEWIAVDLGQDMRIDQVVIDWELAHANDFEVRTRSSAEGFFEDPAQWQERGTVAGFLERHLWAVNEMRNEEDVVFDFAGGQVVLGDWMKAESKEIHSAPVIARHLMIHATAMGPNNPRLYSIYEIKVAARPAN